MGSIVKAVTKPLKGAVSGLLGKDEAPTIIMPAATAAPVQTAQAAAAETPVQTQTESESGISNEAAGRKGKKALTIRRNQLGGGNGLNV